MEEKNKYHGGKIYTLRSPSTDKIYIGSTTQSLAKRKALHKVNKHNEIAQLNDFYIELLENFKCENREELCKREGELIRANDKCINKCIAGITQKEYYIDNKENAKEYYENNKELIKEKRRAYYADNKEKEKENKRKWYADNIEKEKEKQRAYYADNKEKIKERERERKLYIKNKNKTI